MRSEKIQRIPQLPQRNTDASTSYCKDPNEARGDVRDRDKRGEEGRDNRRVGKASEIMCAASCPSL